MLPKSFTLKGRSMSRRALLRTFAAGAIVRNTFGAQNLRMNQVQVLGSHNSYKRDLDSAWKRLLRAREGMRYAGLEYNHIPLQEQLQFGLRGLELDVYHDPDGGRYASPWGLRFLAESGELPDYPYDPSGEMKRSGLKVLHIQDIDFRTHAYTFQAALTALLEWSNAHPNHLPVIITMNAKDEVIDRPELTRPLAFDSHALAEIDREILRVFPRQRLIRPSDIQADFSCLRDAILKRGWPKLDDVRGRFLFVLDEPEVKRTRYLQAHAGGTERVLFVVAPEDSPEAGFFIVNDPLRHGSLIRRLVGQGFLVRTRSDADTKEARSGDYRRARAAFTSGAQIVSTDYYLPDQIWGKQFVVRTPGAAAFRCNPLVAAARCRLLEG